MGSHINHNILMEPRLRVSPRHGGQGFFELFVLIRRGGDPSGAAAIIVHGGVKKISYHT